MTEAPLAPQCALPQAATADEGAGRGNAPQVPPSPSSQRSPQNIRLVDCASPCPTFNDKPDAPRMEFATFQKKATQLAEEFFCSRDVPGMITSVMALGCESFHDELIATLIRTSIDRGDVERADVVELCKKLMEDGQATNAQLMRGFEKLVLSWEDVRLDVPDIANRLMEFLSAGLIDRSEFARLPEKLLSALVLAPGAAQEYLKNHLEDLLVFKAELAVHLETDLFSRRSVEAFGAWLRSQNKAAFHHEVVIAAGLGSFVTAPSPDAFWTACLEPPALAAEKRELVLTMFAELQSMDEGFLLCETDIQIGFSRLLGIVGQEAKESPQSVEFFVSLLCIAVEKELLPAEFLKSARRMRFGGAQGVGILRKVMCKTPMHSRRVWGTGDIRQFRKEFQETILEYFDSRSTDELALIVQELHLSEEEQSQFVRKLLVAGMERGEPDVALDAVAELLDYCWSKREVGKAFQQMRDIAQDLMLDLPNCRELTDDLVRTAAGRGLLDKSDLDNDGATIV